MDQPYMLACARAYVASCTRTTLISTPTPEQKQFRNKEGLSVRHFEPLLRFVGGILFAAVGLLSWLRRNQNPWLWGWILNGTSVVQSRAQRHDEHVFISRPLVLCRARRAASRTLASASRMSARVQNDRGWECDDFASPAILYVRFLPSQSSISSSTASRRSVGVTSKENCVVSDLAGRCWYVVNFSTVTGIVFYLISWT